MGRIGRYENNFCGILVGGGSGWGFLWGVVLSFYFLSVVFGGVGFERV